MKSLHQDYDRKPPTYFSGARKSFVDILPRSTDARLLEIGCGNGDTGAYALSTGKAGSVFGVELCAEPAAEAAKHFSMIIVGDIETVDLPFKPCEFDVLILSEVLEHLRDPWTTLRRLREYLKPGAIVIAGSPNVSHHSVIRSLFRGLWTYEPTGIMDRTHMRWFTPSSYKEMFESCGYAVSSSGPAYPLRFKAKLFNTLTFGRYEHLLHSQIQLCGKRL